MSGLQQQLSRLSGQAASATDRKIRVPSLLFDLKKAQHIDHDSIFNLGNSGFLEIKKLEPRLGEFELELFNKSATFLNRELETKGTHKFLEYLLRQYHIHVHNVDALMECALPFHETNIFARLVQLAKIDGSMWDFMSRIKQTGVPLLRSILIARAKKERPLRSFLCEAVRRSVNMVVFSEVIEIQKISDAFLGPLIEYILEGLSSRAPDFRFATYIIVSSLAGKTNFSTELLNDLAQRISESLSFADPERAILAMIYLFQTQNTENLAVGNLKSFVLHKDLIHVLTESQGKEYKLTNFLSALVRFLVPKSTKPKYNAILQQLLQEIDMSGADRVLVQSLYDLFASHHQQAAVKKIVGQHLKVVAAKYGNALEGLLTGTQDSALLLEFSNLLHASSKFQSLPGTDTMLFLALMNPSSAIRLNALAFLESKLKSQSSEELIELYRTSVHRFLLEDDQDVVDAILASPKLLIAHLDSNLLVSLLTDILNSQFRVETREKVAELLITRLGKHDDAHFNKVLPSLFRHLVFSKRTQVLNKTCLAIASKLAHPLFKGFDKIDPNSSAVDINNQLVSTLKQNITGKTFALWKSLTESNEPNPLLLSAGALSLLNCNVPQENFTAAADLFLARLRRLPVDTKYAEGLELSQPFPFAASPENVGTLLVQCLAQLLRSGQFGTATVEDVQPQAHRAQFLRAVLSLPFLDQAGDLLIAILVAFGEFQLLALHHVWSDSAQSAPVRSRALSIAASLIAARPVNYEQFLPSLLAQLANSSESVRASAIGALSRLPAAPSKPGPSIGQALPTLPQGSYSALLSELSTHSALFLNDASSLHRFLLSAPAELTGFLWVSACRTTTSLLPQLDGVPVPPPALQDLLESIVAHLEQPTTAASLVLLKSLVSLPGKLLSGKEVSSVLTDLLAFSESADRVSHTIAFIKLLTAEFTEKLGKVGQQHLASSLVKLYASPNAELRTSLNLVLPSLPLPAKLLYDMLKPVAAPARPSSSAKKPKLVAEEQNSEAYLAQLNGTLELLLMREIPATTEFYSALSAALGQLVESDEEGEYPKQLILALLTQWMEQHGAVLAKELEQLLQLDGVLQSIRTSSSPQTHNQALSFVAAVAQYLPNKVFDHTLPLLTFMGTTTARQDDNQSSKVMLKTIQAILPPLLKQDGPKGLQKVLSVIVRTFESIPPQRQLALLNCLLETVGTDSLAVLLFVFLIHNCGRAQLSVLLTEISPAGVLNSFGQLLSWMTALPTLNNAGDIAHVLKDVQPSPSDLQEFEVSVITLVSDTLLDARFVEKVVSVDRLSLQESYVVLFRTTLQLLTIRSAQLVDKTLKKSHAHFKTIVRLSYDLTDILNGLIDISTFVGIIGQLLHHSDPQIRRRSLNLFNDKVTQDRSQLTAEQVSQLIGLGPGLLEVVKSAGGAAEAILNKQTALLSLEILVRHFSTHAASTFLEFLGEICTVLEKETSPILLSTCLITCTTFMAELGPKVLSLLSRIVPLIFASLSRTVERKSQLEAEVKKLLQVSALSSLQLLVTKLNRFLSPYLGRLFELLLQPGLVEAPVEVHSKVASVMEAAAQHMGARLVVPALLPLHEKAAKHPVLLSWFFRALQKVGDVMLARDFAHQHKPVFELFTQAFDYRSNSKLDQTTIDTVENSMIDALMPWVLKCGEGEFKPLFHNLAYWVGEEPENDFSRSVIFYKWVNRLSVSLQSLFVPYYSYIFDSCLDLLSRCSSRGVELNNKDKKKRKQAEEDSNQKEHQKVCVEQIISSFSTSFEYDTTNFFTDDIRAAKMTEALVLQLENLQFGTDFYAHFVSSTLTPAIARFATRLDDQKWKPLNYQVLLRSRDSLAIVREASIRTIHAIFDLIGEPYAIMIPESVSFISELMEDSNIQVEKATHELIASINKYVSEENGLSAYL